MLEAAKISAIKAYTTEIQRYGLERQRATRFALLLAEIFPTLKGLADDYSHSHERSLKILRAGKETVGHVDAYYRNAVIEFEASLAKTGEHAEDQLREYAAGLWNDHSASRRNLVCIATDGVEWRLYRPSTRADDAPVDPADVTLTEIERFDLREDAAEEFYFFLDRVLLREVAILPTTNAIQRDFGSKSLAFSDALTELAKSYQLVKSAPEVSVARDEWGTYLQRVYGDLSGSDDLFLKHTYLSVFSRLLVWAATAQKRDRTPQSMTKRLNEVLSGTAFQALGFLNLHEAGFFEWISRAEVASRLRPLWSRLLAQLSTFELDAIDEDILKGVYQDLVDPETRHDLGEYYTPDWLADMIVESALANWNKTYLPRVLDPACGSGTFLRVSLRHLSARLGNQTAEAKLDALTSRVVGFDIHPLAVQIAKATYAIAVRGLVREARKPVEIPVYLSDSLFLPAPVSQQDWMKEQKVELKFADKTVSAPAIILNDPVLFGRIVSVADECATEIANGNEETLASVQAALNLKAPGYERLSDANKAKIAIASLELAQELGALKKKRRDSIWAFVLRNMHRPALMRQQFDFVFGNPPWLVYRQIRETSYQAEVGALADAYALAMNGRLRTHLEVAAVFLLRSTETYLKDGGRLGFVMPRSVFNADQHDAVRRGTYEAPCHIDEVWDLRKVEPLFLMPSCVLFAVRNAKRKKEDRQRFDARVFKGKLPHKNATRPEADATISSKGAHLYVNWLGEHTCWYPGRLLERAAPSVYLGRFRQGATILPRNFYFVNAIEGLPKNANVEVFVETDREQAKEGKPPYKTEFLSGYVEARFLYRVALSKQVFPFVFREPPWCALPVVASGEHYAVLTAAALREQGYRAMGKWMTDVEARWNKHRQGKAARQTAEERLDYHGELSKQRPDAANLVLYNTSGTNLAAVHVPPGRERLIVDHKCYWLSASTPEEADYLMAVLNADITNELIKPFQSVGLQGERDVHTKVLSLPIPEYDGGNGLHREIVEMARHMSAVAQRIEIPDAMLGRARQVIRSALVAERKQLNGLVKSLLGAN